MTNTLKILGQSIPVANVLTTLYTVPAATSASISSLIVCNQNSSTFINFYVSLAIGGAADAPVQYIYYGLPLDGFDTFVATIGISLAATDQVRVKSNLGSVSFVLTGVEVS